MEDNTVTPGRAEVRLRESALALGRAKARVMELESERVQLKAVLVGRLVGTENPLTKKPHSASSADDAAAIEASYAEHQMLQRQAVVAEQVAYGEWEVAKLFARLAGKEVE